MGPGGVGTAAFDFSAFLATAAGDPPVPTDTVRVLVRRTADQVVLTDTSFALAGLDSTGDSARVNVRVTLTQETEDVTVDVTVRGAGFVWYSGSTAATLTSGGTATPPALTLSYVGPGAGADSVRINVITNRIVGGVGLTVSASVWVPGGILTGVPVGFRVGDTTVAGLSNIQLNSVRFTGRVPVRDSTWVYAETPTHLRDSVLIAVIPPAAQLVKISGDNQQGIVGTPLAAPLVVRVLDMLGGGFSGLGVSWSGTNAQVSLPSVLTDSAGFAQVNATPTATGGVTVQATAAGLTGSPATFSVVGQAGAVDALVLTPDTSIVLNPGDTARFTAACTASGLPIACGPVAWTSLTPAIGSVDATGKATAAAAGAARIRAAAGGGVDTATFIVNAIVTVTVLPVDTVITAVGDTVQLRAEATRFLGGVTPLPNAQVVWQTLTPTVALVDTAGRARIVGPGTAFVRATNAGRSGIDTLRVRQTPFTFRVDPDTAIIGVTGTTFLVPRPFDRRGFPIAGRRTTWVSRNPTAASVDTTGRVTGNAIDSAGVYVVGTDSTFSDSTLVRVVTNPPQLIQWGADSTSVGRGTTFQQAILLSLPAPAGGVPVSIVSSDTLILKPTTSVITFTSGQTSRTVSLEGRAAGRVTITATDTTGQFAPDTLIVGVLSTLEFRTIANPTAHATTFSLNSAEQRAVLVFLSDPAPPGGLAVSFAPSVAGIATVAPPTAVIPGGQLSVQVDLQGTGVGSTTLTPTASGYVGTLSNVTTFPAQFTVNLPFPQRLGLGQYFSGSVSVPNAMDRSTRVTLGRTTPGVGQAPDSVVIAANTFSASFDYVALATGFDTVTANRSGWIEGRQAVQVTTPRVILSMSTNLTAGAPNSFWTAAVRDSFGGGGHPRFDTLTVNVASRNPAVVAIDTGSAVIAAGNAQASRNAVRPVGGGTAYVVVTAAGHFPDSVLVTVTAPQLTLNIGFPQRIGTRQTTANNSVSLPFTRPTPLVVHLADNNPAVATVPDSVTIPANTFSIAFTIDGQAPGLDSIIATAVGFSPDTGTMTVMTNRLLQSGLSTSYLITAGPANFSVRPADSAGSIHATLDTIAVAVSSTDTTVLTLDSATVHVLPGQTISNATPLRVRGLGQARVHFSGPPLYPLDSSFVITVNPAPLSVNVSFPQRLGVGQFFAGNSVSIPNAATDTVRIALTHIGTIRGVVPDTIVILPGQFSAQFRWDALIPGTDSIVATSGNFVPDTDAVVIMRPRFNIGGIPASGVVNDTFFVNTSAADSVGSVHTVIDTVFAVLSSSDTTVLVVDSTPVRHILPGASSTGSARLIARGPGTARIIVTDTSGLYIPDSTNVVVITAPAISVSPTTETLGTGQQSANFRVTIPNGVIDTTRVALTLSDTTVAGLSTDTVKINPGQTFSPLFTVFAKNVIASIQLTASAPGFTQGTSTIIVGAPQLFTNATTVAYVGQPPLTMSVSTRDQTNQTQPVHDTLVITLSSTDSSVLVPDSSTVRIPANGSSVSTTWRTVGPGTAYLVASAPGYPVADSSSQITVSIPPIALSLDRSVGTGQRLSGFASIPFNLPAGDTVFLTITTTVPGALTMQTVDTIFPFGSNTSFTAVGATVGTTVTTISAPGFVTSTPDTTQVGVPHLRLNGPNSGNSGTNTTLSITAEDQLGVARPVDQALVITLTVDDPALADFGGSPTAQLTIAAGSQGSPGVTLNLKTAGNVTITATAAGYTNGVRIITIN